MKSFEEELQQIKSIFGRHLVVMTWFEGNRDRQGIFLRDEAFFPCIASGTLICCEHHEGQLWGILTAGHVISDYQNRRATTHTVADNHRIWDGWIEATNSIENWMPFNPFDWPSSFIDSAEEGIDCGVVLLPKFYLKPMSQRMVGWSSAEFPESSKIAGYVILGEPFRNARIETFGSNQIGVDELVYVPQPKLVFVEEVGPLPEYALCPRKQFFGKIRFREELPDIRGMSGGPIFRILESEDGRSTYQPAAIQSRWLSSSRIIIGTEYPTSYEWCVQNLKSLFENLGETERHQYLIDVS